MNASGDAAEQTFRMIIDGTEFVLRITGNLVKETATMLYAISKDKEQTNIGKTNLAKMLRNCRDTKLFAIQRKDLDKFVAEAKNYGIYYCTLIDKKDKSADSIVDIMVRGDDASRVNRIVERFDLAITDTASLRTESIKEKEEVTNDNKEVVPEKTEPSVDDNKLDDIMGRIPVPEEVKDGVSESFLSKNEPQLDYSLKMKPVENQEALKAKSDELLGKKSVRQQLKEIAEELKNKSSKEQPEKMKDKKSKKKKKSKNKVEVNKNERTR